MKRRVPSLQFRRRREPKFHVGETVWSRIHEKFLEVRVIVWDDDYRMWGYFLRGVPMYWLEYNLRRDAPKPEVSA